MLKKITDLFDKEYTGMKTTRKSRSAMTKVRISILKDAEITVKR